MALAAKNVALHPVGTFGRLNFGGLLFPHFPHVMLAASRLSASRTLQTIP
jgi:hypothetical protein